MGKSGLNMIMHEWNFQWINSFFNKDMNDSCADISISDNSRGVSER